MRVVRRGGWRTGRVLYFDLDWRQTQKNPLTLNVLRQNEGSLHGERGRGAEN